MIFNFSYFVLCCVIATPLLPMAPHEPSTRSTDFASPAELLSELSIFGFSLLSPKDLAAAGETKKDVRRKAFAMLFNKAPVVTRVHLFKELTQLQAQETEEDFKLRRFTDLESFKQLQFSSQEDIVEFIQDVSNTFEMSDVGVPGVSGNVFGMSDADVGVLEFFKMSTPDLRGPRGATATQGGGQGAITQGGQGTCQQWHALRK